MEMADSDGVAVFQGDLLEFLELSRDILTTQLIIEEHVPHGDGNPHPVCDLSAHRSGGCQTVNEKESPFREKGEDGLDHVRRRSGFGAHVVVDSACERDTFEVSGEDGLNLLGGHLGINRTGARVRIAACRLHGLMEHELESAAGERPGKPLAGGTSGKHCEINRDGEGNRIR